ncbi:MAG TPA: trypsin-like peptidase domain-containing protein [Isosphaeraceae bacterium]
MSRKSPPLLLAATLLVGLLLGLNLNAYRGRPLAAVPAPQVPVADVSAPARTESGIYAELDRQFALFEHVNRTFELVARAVSPSVVHIVAHKVANEDRHPREFEETGSGVIVRAEGQPGLYVLTNNHVVATALAEDVQIYLHDGRALKPEWLKADSRADVAVMKLGREDLPAARLGDSDRVAVGSWVMAIGSPFGLSYSVSQGIISGRGRHDTDLAEAGVENQDFLQTDAAINPGNSGGPLVNMKGEVIGLNIAILSNGGGNDGVGFTIPITLARWIMNSLIASGRVSRGALGVRLGLEFDHDTAVALGLDRPRGAMVDTVDKASPAALSGLRGGDVILRFNGADVADLNHLINLVSMAQIGRAAEIVLWRDRKEHVVKVTIGDKDQAVAALPPRPSRPLPTPNGLLRRPNHAGGSETSAVLGLELVTLDSATGPRLGLPANLAGAVVTKVEPDSPLAAYFKPLDVIHSIAGRPIRGAEEAVKGLGAGGRQDHLEIGLHRPLDGVLQSIKVRLP